MTHIQKLIYPPIELNPTASPPFPAGQELPIFLLTYKVANIWNFEKLLHPIFSFHRRRRFVAITQDSFMIYRQREGHFGEVGKNASSFSRFIQLVIYCLPPTPPPRAAVPAGRTSFVQQGLSSLPSPSSSSSMNPVQTGWLPPSKRFTVGKWNPIISKNVIHFGATAAGSWSKPPVLGKG